MKRCDSQTRSMAACTSWRIEEYWPVRSSSGTLSASDGAFGMKTHFHSGFVISAVAVHAASRTVLASDLDPVAAHAHPTDDSSRVSDNECEIRDIPCDHRPGTDERILADRRSAHDR